MSSVTFHIDPTRSSRTKVDNLQMAVWVAVCANERDSLDDPMAKQAAVMWAQTRYRINGAIDQIQGPLDDDGTTQPFAPTENDPVNSGVVSADAYRHMAAKLAVAKANGAPSRFVMFVRVLSNVL